MFHFAIPALEARHVEAVEGLPVARDADFARRVEAGWLQGTQGRLPADMYPLRNATIFRWDGATPRDHAMCRTLVEASTKLSPHYVWIDGRVKSFRESEVWDLS